MSNLTLLEVGHHRRNVIGIAHDIARNEGVSPFVLDDCVPHIKAFMVETLSRGGGVYMPYIGALQVRGRVSRSRGNFIAGQVKHRRRVKKLLLKKSKFFRELIGQNPCDSLRINGATKPFVDFVAARACVQYEIARTCIMSYFLAVCLRLAGGGDVCNGVFRAKVGEDMLEGAIPYKGGTKPIKYRHVSIRAVGELYGLLN